MTTRRARCIPLSFRARVGAFAIFAGTACAAPLPIDTTARNTPVDFPTEVFPFLKANCIACHNKTTRKAGLNMETPELMKRGGESGPAVLPGNGTGSPLFQSAAHTGDSDMPPKSNKVGAVNLKPGELALLKAWIDQGAKPGNQAAREIAWKPLPPGLHPIYAVALSTGGEFAACGRANRIFVYDLATRRPTAQIEAHRDMVLALSLSPDGTRLASGSFGEVKLWKAAPPAETPGPDARSLMDAAARVGRLDRAANLAALDVAFQAGALTAANAEVTALKDRLKKAGDAAGDTKKQLEEKRAAAKKAADSKEAARKALDEIGAQVASPPPNPPDAALAKKQEEAKTKFEAASKAERDALEAVKAAENASADAAAEVPKVTGLLADAEKAVAAVKTAQTAAQQSQKKLGEELAAATKALAETGKAHGALILSPDQRWLVEPRADGSSLVWAMGSGWAVARFVPKEGSKSALSWKPDSQLVAPAEGALENLPTKWSLERTLGTGDAKSEIEDRVNALAFSPDGKTLAVGSGEASRGGDITLWDLATGKLKSALRDRHSDTVLSLDFSPDGKLIASGGADKQLRVSEIASGRQLKVFEGHTHHVLGVSWRADGRMLASSGADNVIKVWDWTKGERRKSLDGWDREVTSVRYLGAGTRLVTTSGDKQVRLVGEDGATPAPLPGAADFMQASAVSRDGRWVAAGGEDSVLRVWETKAGSAAAALPRP